MGKGEWIGRANFADYISTEIDSHWVHFTAKRSAINKKQEVTQGMAEGDALGWWRNMIFYSVSGIFGKFRKLCAVSWQWKVMQMLRTKLNIKLFSQCQRESLAILN